MSHEIDFSTGAAGFAYRDDVQPWHGLGHKLTADADTATWTREARLDWTAEKRPVRYRTPDPDGRGDDYHRTMSRQFVLARSDTGDALGIVSDRYRVHQPADLLGFYDSVAKELGYRLKTAGSLRGGRLVFAMAETPNAAKIKDEQLRMHLLLSTTFDGSDTTLGKHIDECVVCANTYGSAMAEGGLTARQSHRSAFDPIKFAADLGLSAEAFERDVAIANQLARVTVDASQTVEILVRAYFDQAAQEARELDETREQVEKMLRRVGTALVNAPGAQLEARRGTAWGAFNAVTWDVDHTMRAHSQDNRLVSAWWGKGEEIKQRAMVAALELVD